VTLYGTFVNLETPWCSETRACGSILEGNSDEAECGRKVSEFNCLFEAYIIYMMGGSSIQQQTD